MCGCVWPVLATKKWTGHFHLICGTSHQKTRRESVDDLKGCNMHFSHGIGGCLYMEEIATLINTVLLQGNRY